MSDGAGEIRKRILRLTKNVLVLAFALVFLTLLRPELLTAIDFVAAGFMVTGDVIVNIIALLFIIYYGYFILIDVKYFFDSVSARMGRKETGELKSVTNDVAAIIALILASALLTPALASIQNIGATTAKIVNIILLAIGFFIVYHLANQIYHLIRKRIEKFAQTTRHHRAAQIKKTKEEEPSE